MRDTTFEFSTHEIFFFLVVVNVAYAGRSLLPVEIKGHGSKVTGIVGNSGNIQYFRLGFGDATMGKISRRTV